MKPMWIKISKQGFLWLKPSHFLHSNCRLFLTHLYSLLQSPSCSLWSNDLKWIWPMSGLESVKEFTTVHGWGVLLGKTLIPKSVEWEEVSNRCVPNSCGHPLHSILSPFSFKIYNWVLDLSITVVIGGFHSVFYWTFFQVIMLGTHLLYYLLHFTYKFKQDSIAYGIVQFCYKLKLLSLLLKATLIRFLLY